MCLLAMMLAAGCATTGGRDQLVSVDSSPRGAVVTREADGLRVGVTPAFIEQPRGATQGYALRFEDGATARTSAECTPRTSFAVADALPALPLLVLPPPIGAIAYLATSAGLVAIDTANGSIFECPTSVRADHPSTTTHEPARDTIDDAAWSALPAFAPTEDCPRFLILTPEAPTEPGSKALAQAAADLLSAHSACTSVVNVDQSSGMFDRKRINYRRPLDSAHFKRSDVYEVASRTRSTHLVLVEVDADAFPPRANLRVVDVHSLASAAGPSFELGPPPVEGPGRGFFRETLRFIAGLIPDTFIWNIAAKSFPFVGAQGATVVRNEFTAPLLATALNFQLSHFDHPEVHAPWDFQLSLAPDLLIFLNGVRLQLRDKGGARRTVTLTMVQAIVPVSPRVSFFTPAGVTSFWAGAGPGLVLDIDEPALKPGVRVTLFAHGGASHNVFLTRNFFIGVAAQVNRSFWPHVKRNGVQLDWILQAQVNLGFTFPEMTDEMRARL